MYKILLCTLYSVIYKTEFTLRVNPKQNCKTRLGKLAAVFSSYYNVEHNIFKPLNKFSIAFDTNSNFLIPTSLQLDGVCKLGLFDLTEFMKYIRVRHQVVTIRTFEFVAKNMFLFFFM